MARDRFSECGATDEEVLESLQEEFDGMQRTARTYAARCRDLEGALKRIEFELDGGLDAASRKARIAVVRKIIAGCFPAQRQQGDDHG